METNGESIQYFLDVMRRVNYCGPDKESHEVSKFITYMVEEQGPFYKEKPSKKYMSIHLHASHAFVTNLSLLPLAITSGQNVEGVSRSSNDENDIHVPYAPDYNTYCSNLISREELI